MKTQPSQLGGYKPQLPNLTTRLYLLRASGSKEEALCSDALTFVRSSSLTKYNVLTHDSGNTHTLVIGKLEPPPPRCHVGGVCYTDLVIDSDEDFVREWAVLYDGTHHTLSFPYRTEADRVAKVLARNQDRFTGPIVVVTRLVTDWVPDE